MEAHGPSLLRLSLAQAMKLVVFCAAASACVAPMVRLWEAGAIKTTERVAFAMIFEAVAVPLVWALLSFILIRRGTGKDRLIAAFLLGSVSVALGFATYSFIFFTGIYRGPLGAPRAWTSLLGLALHFAIMLALGAAFVFLGSRLVRKPRGLLRDDALKSSNGRGHFDCFESDYPVP